MTISDIVFETMTDLIDGCIGYYDEDNYLDVANNQDIIEVVAVHLKITNRHGYALPTPEDLARIESLDWKKEAKRWITEYITEKHMR